MLFLIVVVVLFNLSKPMQFSDEGTQKLEQGPRELPLISTVIFQ